MTQLHKTRHILVKAIILIVIECIKAHLEKKMDTQATIQVGQ